MSFVIGFSMQLVSGLSLQAKTSRYGRLMFGQIFERLIHSAGRSAVRGTGGFGAAGEKRTNTRRAGGDKTTFMRSGCIRSLTIIHKRGGC